MKVHIAKKASFALLTGVVLFILTGSIFGQNMFRKVNDFDGDGKADYVITRNENGAKVWYIWQSTGGFRALQFGFDADKEASGDYDGDGKIDIAVLRTAPYAQIFVFQSSTNSFIQKAYGPTAGLAGVEPFQQDYDGDGKTDYGVVLRNANGTGSGFFTESSNSSTTRFYDPGVNETLLRLGDLTGNGTSDIVYQVRPDNRLNISNYPCCFLTNIVFGTTGDQYVAGDFDGDGKGDLAVFRESDGSWWYIRSSDSSIRVAQFGQAGDKPVPADYDGDGKTDIAIWRNGTYWVYGSQNGVTTFNWGLSTDKPIAY